VEKRYGKYNGPLLSNKIFEKWERDMGNTMDLYWAMNVNIQ